MDALKSFLCFRQGLCQAWKATTVTAAAEALHLDKIDLGAHLGKISYELRPLLRMLDFDLSVKQREIRDLLDPSSNSSAILSSSETDVCFDNFPYLLSETTKNVLIYIHLKDNICPQTLLCGPAGSDIYQETLAKTLAKHFGARSLIVDSLVLPGGTSPKDAETGKENSRSEKSGVFPKQRAAQSDAMKLKVKLLLGRQILWAYPTLNGSSFLEGGL